MITDLVSVWIDFGFIVRLHGSGGGSGAGSTDVHGKQSSPVQQHPRLKEKGDDDDDEVEEDDDDDGDDDDDLSLI